MSQFRIKNIDIGMPDEWIYKTNDGIGIVGDDIDARDPNELAEGILDTQTLILKTSQLPSSSILKPTSGLAERITLLEGVVGNSTLQDIYSNGNVISVLPGRPLMFGSSEELKLDDSGNISFKAASLKVKGNSLSNVELTSSSVTSNLGDFLVGATSPGYQLTLKAENYLNLKDIFLTNPVTLSEPGNTSLLTSSQSLVGAINELKSSSFNTSFQAVYSQSNPPKVIINSLQGGLTIEDPSNTSLSDTLKVTGIFNATRRIKTADLRVGSNTTIDDVSGILTSSVIKTTNKIESPLLSSGTSELTIQDKRVSFPFSDSSVSGLSTTKKSVIGAINELKTDVTNVGNASTIFNIQHDPATGVHGIITTQSGMGDNSTKRIIVKNQLGTEVFSVNGLGEIASQSATIGGLNFINLMTSLNSHLSNDGRDHSAFAAHILDPNPHNNVKTILGLSGNVFMTSGDGSVLVSTTGNTINFKSSVTFNLQQVYDNLSTKVLSLTSSGIDFQSPAASDSVLKLLPTQIVANKELNFQQANATISSQQSLDIKPATDLNLTSTSGNVSISSLSASKTVKIQDINFNEVGITTLPSILGTSVLSAFNTLADNFKISLDNPFDSSIDYNFPFFADTAGRAWPHIADLHPANEFIPTKVDFYWKNDGALYYPISTVAASGSGAFYTSGTRAVKASSATTLLNTFIKGTKLFPVRLSSCDLTISSALADEEYLTIGNKSMMAIASHIGAVSNTLTVNVAEGDFRLEKDPAGSIQTNQDKTRDNLIATINDYSFASNTIPATQYMKAGIWGDPSSSIITVNTAFTNGQSFTITIPSYLSSEASTVVLTARTTPSGLSATMPPSSSYGWIDFPAHSNPTASAFALAEAINRTTFRSTFAGGLGHKCKATVNGTIVKIEWYKPGVSGQLVTIGTSAGDITGAGLLTGGTCMLRVYDMQVNRISPLLATYTEILSGGLSGATTFTAKEKTSDYFLSEEEALSSLRYAPFYKAKQLGTIEDKSGNTIVFKIRT